MCSGLPMSYCKLRLFGRISCFSQPTVPFILVFGNPLIHVALNILGTFFAFVHTSVLFVDIAKRQGKYLKKFPCCGILLGEFFVGNYLDVRNTTTKPSFTGSEIAPSMPLNVIRSTPERCASDGLISGTFIHTTSLPGFSLKMVQFGAQV